MIFINLMLLLVDEFKSFWTWSRMTEDETYLNQSVDISDFENRMQKITFRNNY